MDRERLIDAALTSLLLLLIGFVVIAMSGCLSVSLIGGRHQNVTNIGSDDNDSSPDMEAPSDTRIKDVLKDLFPTGIPDLPIVIPGDLPPDAGGNSPPATNNPPPVVPDEPVSDGTLRGDFLWKPVAESGGLVVLMDSGLTGLIAGVTADGEPGNFTGVGNGNREHYRWSKEGPQWPPNVMVIVTLADGLPITYVVADPANRASPSPQ